MCEIDEYIVHGEPGQKEKADAWQTAIGLQDVDGLKVSPYLLDTARQHIEEDIAIDEARELNMSSIWRRSFRYEIARRSSGSIRLRGRRMQWK